MSPAHHRQPQAATPSLTALDDAFCISSNDLSKLRRRAGCQQPQAGTLAVRLHDSFPATWSPSRTGSLPALKGHSTSTLVNSNVVKSQGSENTVKAYPRPSNHYGNLALVVPDTEAGRQDHKLELDIGTPIQNMHYIFC